LQSGALAGGIEFRSARRRIRRGLNEGSSGCGAVRPKAGNTSKPNPRAQGSIPYLLRGNGDGPAETSAVGDRFYNIHPDAPGVFLYPRSRFIQLGRTRRMLSWRLSNPLTGGGSLRRSARRTDAARPGSARPDTSNTDQSLPREKKGGGLAVHQRRVHADCCGITGSRSAWTDAGVCPR